MILYSDSECLFDNNGYGRLAEAIRAEVVEEINGEYTLEVDYPINGKHYGDIAIGRLILAPHEDSDDLQPFRIYRISRPISGRVTVYARHISYDLATIPILPFTANGAVATVAALQNNRYFGSAFQFSTDLDTTYTFTLSTPATVRQVMGGMDDSILSVFGGEWEFDRFSVRLLAERGEDKGVRIRYGKNLTDLVRDTDIDGRYSAIMPYYVNGETGELVTLPELTLPIPGAMTYSGTYRNEDGTAYDNGTEDYTGVTAQTRIYPIDLSAEFWDAPSVAMLREAAQKKLRKYAGAGPADNLKVSFVNLWQTEEYKNYAPLQSVCIGDTVEVYYSALGVTVNMRVIRTVYDLINKRYNAIELGNPAYNMSNAVTGISEGMAQTATRNAISKATRAAASIADAQTQLIAGQEGGNFVIDRDASGRPTGWLIMDTADKTTAEHVLRANLSGIGYSPNGYNGPFTTAWTIDGKFNADFIQTGTLIADLIKAGILTDSAGKFYLNMETGALTMQDGTFTGTVNATAGTIGGFSVDDEKMLYGTPGQAGSVMIWPDGNGPGLNYGNVGPADAETQYVIGLGASGTVFSVGLTADGMIHGQAAYMSSEFTIQWEGVVYCSLSTNGLDIYDPTTQVAKAYLHDDATKLAGDVEMSGKLTGSTSERVSATVSGLTITLYKNAGSVTAYIRGTTTADLPTTSGYVDLITPNASWMPAEQVIGYQILNNSPWRGQVVATPTKLRLGYTRNASNTAADIPTGTSIYSFVTWTAK